MINFKFNIGDVVVITNDNYEYPYYDNWFVENNCENLIPFFKNYIKDFTYKKYKVVAKGGHKFIKDRALYAIKDIKMEGNVYLFDERGLEKSFDGGFFYKSVYSSNNPFELSSELSSYTFYQPRIYNPFGKNNTSVFNKEIIFTNNKYVNILNEIELVYINDKKKQVCIKWEDGTTTKSTCSDMDEFDLNVGFAIAFTRKFLKNDKVTNKLLDKKLVKNNKKNDRKEENKR